MLILDNMPAHQSERAAHCLKQRGAWSLLMPKYGPELNDIEELCAKIMAHRAEPMPAPVTRGVERV